MQIQDNGNDPEEEGGDDFVDIDDMLLDELEVYRQQCMQLLTARLATAATTATATVATRATATAAAYSHCHGRHDGCCDGHGGCCDCSYDSTTKARPPEGLKGQRPEEEEAEGYWWW